LKTQAKRVAVVTLLFTGIAGLAGQGCYRKEAPPDTRTSAQRADADWFNQKAVEVQGNFDRLTPEEKMRAIRFSRGSESEARTGMAMASKFQPK
jgi:hypothetical protein